MSGNAQQDYIIEMLELMEAAQFLDGVRDPNERERLHQALELRDKYEEELKIVEGLSAQNRGMLWYNGFGKGPLYAGTNIRQGRFEKLAYESKRMAVAVSRKDLG